MLPYRIQWKGVFNYNYTASESEQFKPAILNNDNYRSYEENYSSNTSEVYINTYFYRNFDLYIANVGDRSLISGSGKFPGEENGYPLQYSCLENSMERRSLAGYSPWGCKESDKTERLN